MTSKRTGAFWALLGALLAAPEVMAIGVVGLGEPHVNVFVAVRGLLPESTMVTGIRFHSNDATVFSEVSLATEAGGRWLPRVGTVLRSVPNVIGRPGDVTVQFPAYETTENEHLWAIVRFPDNAPLLASGLGGGPGIGWRDSPVLEDERSLFSVDGAMNEFTPAFDISFVTAMPQVGKAGASQPPQPQDEKPEHLKARTYLAAGSPNPANPAARIEFGLARPMHVRLGIYNIAGRRVRDLVQGPLSAGVHQRNWNGRDDHGMLVASGIYIVTLRAAEKVLRQKLVILK
ncbi:MAG: FlgD immunoglobulin-like domain containing protein [Candidatus Krumholzibacteriia bacterium]